MKKFGRALKEAFWIAHEGSQRSSALVTTWGVMLSTFALASLIVVPASSLWGEFLDRNELIRWGVVLSWIVLICGYVLSHYDRILDEKAKAQVQAERALEFEKALKPKLKIKWEGKKGSYFQDGLRKESNLRYDLYRVGVKNEGGVLLRSCVLKVIEIEEIQTGVLPISPRKQHDQASPGEENFQLGIDEEKYFDFLYFQRTSERQPNSLGVLYFDHTKGHWAIPLDKPLTIKLQATASAGREAVAKVKTVIDDSGLQTIVFSGAES